MGPTADKSCPKCSSKDYRFRARKAVAAVDDRPAAVETTYRCVACGHQWQVRVPGAYSAGSDPP